MNNRANGDRGGAYNISALARMLGKDRTTIRRVITDYGIESTGTRKGHAVYPLPEISRAIYAVPTNGDDLTPGERLSFYRSELARIELEERCGGLIRVEDFDLVYSNMIKTVAATLESLPDVLERDAGLAGRQIDTVIRVVDNLRESMYQKLTDRDTG